MQELEQTLDSREVAEMVEKDHNKLLRDIRRYVEQLGEAKIGHTEFFRESTYHSEQNKEIPCYCITKKGCEFIAHKLTGIKGTVFTARYINRFHEMQDLISRKEKEPELPWFIRRFEGRYIVLWRDFSEITGYDLEKRKPRNWQKLVPGADWNGWGWKCDNNEFKKKYGFDYGTDPCMMYFYYRGVTKALQVLSEEKKVSLKPGAYEMLTEGIDMIQKLGKKEVIVRNSRSYTMFKEKIVNSSPIQIKEIPVQIENIPTQIEGLPIQIKIVLEHK